MKRLTFTAVLVGALVALGGCKKKDGAGGSLKLIPKETGVLVSVNVDRLRQNSKQWDRIAKLRDSDAETKKKYEEFVKGSGFDPFTQASGLLIAVPADPNKAKGDFAMVVTTNKPVDEKKLIGYATEEAKKQGGGDVKTEQYGGKTIYGSAKNEESWATFIDDKTFVVAGKDAIKKVVDLGAGKGESVEKNDGLMALAKRADQGAGVWAVGMVPADAQKQVAPNATISSAVGSLDFQSGLIAKVQADTASPDEAKKLAETATAQLAEAKKNPMVQMMGFQAVTDGMKVGTEGKAFKVDLALNQQQFDELLTKIEGMAKMFGGGRGMGGGMPPGAGEPAMPPGEAPPTAPPAGEMKLKMGEGDKK